MKIEQEIMEMFDKEFGDDVLKTDEFVEKVIDLAQEEERERIIKAIVKNVDMTDEQLQDILGLLTNK